MLRMCVTICIKFYNITKNKPKILLNNELNRKYRFLVSVSHEKYYAISFVIAFKNEKKYAKSSK